MERVVVVETEEEKEAKRIIETWGRFAFPWPFGVTPFDLYDAYEDWCFEQQVQPAVGRWHLYDAYENYENECMKGEG